MEDFSSLLSLVSLNELDLSKCVEITDIGVRELASLKSLPILSSTIAARSQIKFVTLWCVQMSSDTFRCCFACWGGHIATIDLSNYTHFL